jgi:hypothetical protein
VNSTGALVAIVGGFLIAVTLKLLATGGSLPPWCDPFANQAAITWTASMLLCVVGSALHRGAAERAAAGAEPRGAAAVTLWENTAVLGEGFGDTWYRNVIVWTAGFVIVIIGAMVFFSSVIFPTR